MNSNFDLKIEFARLSKYINKSFSNLFQHNKNNKLYDAFKYAIEGGGKRIRPILTMISAGAMGLNPENAITPALSIEILHNFTLLHDDIIDNSPIRHGIPTVYKKWNNDIAILSGDMMIGYAFKILQLNNNFDSGTIAKLTNTLSNALIDVCLGQELDIDFNTSNKVSFDDYLKMIKLKTSSLLCCAVKLGLICANATDDVVYALNNYALIFGIVFQIQDDMLDFNANNIKFGKKLGQDIFEQKKSFPIIKSRQLATEQTDIDFIEKYFANEIVPTEEVVIRFIKIFNKLNIPKIAENTIASYIEDAKKHISILPANNYSKMLDWLLHYILKRDY